MYYGQPEHYCKRHMRSTWLVHLVMISEGFDLKNDADLRD